MKTEQEIQLQQVDALFDKVATTIERARQMAVTTIKTAEVYAKYEIGRYIVEDEQEGHYRAQYGKAVLLMLSTKLIERYGRGWSVDTLEQTRKLYIVYSNSETTLRDLEQTIENPETPSRISNYQPRFTLSWSHYLILMRIDDPNARSFYEIECAREMWSVRQLSRQVGSSLYERLALSRNKDEVMRLAQEGQTVEKPSDIIKNPLTLEFLGLQSESTYTESKLESAIIGKMQQFLLELGRGFLFEARQKRFTFDEQHFYVDLVFYNRLLQCYVLIDLKTAKVSHQDLGQMQMYVNYFDRYVKQEFEKPTIGILLCEEKNDALVQLTLPENANIYATEYSLYLPDKTLLQNKLKQWIEEYNEYSE